MPEIGECFYFGCVGQAGHYLFNERRHSISERVLPATFPIRYDILDGGLLPPWMPHEEGAAALVHVFGWTILTFWDRSVDSRVGCNSSFVIPAILEFDEARRLAQERFPWIWDRYRFEVRLRT